MKTLSARLYHSARSHPVFIKYPSTAQFVKFVIVGFSNVAVDFSIYYLLTRDTRFFGQHLLSANILGFAAATVNSFYWNKYWTFRDQDKNHRKQYAKFLIVSTGGLILAQIIFVFGVHYLKIFDFLIKSIAVIIVTFWNFFINKWWTFRKI